MRKEPEWAMSLARWGRLGLTAASEHPSESPPRRTRPDPVAPPPGRRAVPHWPCPANARCCCPSPAHMTPSPRPRPRQRPAGPGNATPATASCLALGRLYPPPPPSSAPQREARPPPRSRPTVPRPRSRGQTAAGDGGPVAELMRSGGGGARRSRTPGRDSPLSNAKAPARVRAIELLSSGSTGRAIERLLTSGRGSVAHGVAATTLQLQHDGNNERSSRLLRAARPRAARRRGVRGRTRPSPATTLERRRGREREEERQRDDEPLTRLFPL
jgi:hypothetical protein